MEEEQKKKKEVETDDLYQNENVEQAIENDEIKPEEAGFMEGYNEKQDEKPKKLKDIVQDDK